MECKVIELYNGYYLEIIDSNVLTLEDYKSTDILVEQKTIFVGKSDRIPIYIANNCLAESFNYHLNKYMYFISYKKLNYTYTIKKNGIIEKKYTNNIFDAVQKIFLFHGIKNAKRRIRIYQNLN